MKKRIAAIAMLGVGLAFLPVQPAKAATTDQYPVVNHAQTAIHPGDVVHFDVTNLPTPDTQTNGYMTYTNPRTFSTINWRQLGAGRDYTAGIADVGKTLRANFCYGVPTYPGSRIVKQFCGADYITVTAADVVPVVAPSTLLVGGTCHSYLNAGNGSAYAYCYQYSTVGYKSMFLQIRCQDGSYHQGVRVFTAYAVSQAYCAAGQIVTSMVMYFNLYS